MRKKEGTPYDCAPSLLTPPEQYFYKVLSSVIQDRAIIMAKVRIADILRVRSDIPEKTFWRHFSQISQKHIDFVLIHPQTFETLCLIELDDKSHTKSDRIKRDRFVNQIMYKAGLPLHRFQVRRRYSRDNISEMLRAYFSSKV